MSEAGAGWDCHVHVFDGHSPVPAGHYQPSHRPLEVIEAEAARHGVQHLVLVQPSVYGVDNRLLLNALAQAPGRHRGVVVMPTGCSAAELARWHALGVRGARLNCVSPLGTASSPAQAFAEVAPVLLAQGWHLQWYAQAEQLPQIAALHTPDAPVCVLDHLGGLYAGLPDDDPAWAALQRLADHGAWVKLSGWYRLKAAEPYQTLLPRILRVVAMFQDHVVWGSDWPHTSFSADRMPRYASTWLPVEQALGPTQAQALRVCTPAIYR